MVGHAFDPGVPASHPPEVSVVIPTRDREQYVVAAVAAALAQVHVDQEVIVVDDGSRDRTRAALAALADPRLVVLHNDVSQGVASARNHGLARARGRWVAFLDDDDVWAPLMLRTQIDAASRRGASYAYCDSVVLDERLDVIGKINPPPPEAIGRALQSWNYIGGPSVVVIEAEALRRVGGFDERLSVLADWDLWIRLADAGRAAHSRSMLVGYVVHRGGMFTQHPEIAAGDLEYLIEKHRVRTARLGIEPDVARMLVALAYGHARARRRARAVLTALRAAARARSPRYAALGLAFIGGYRFALAVRNRLSDTELPARPDWLAANVAHATPGTSVAPGTVATVVGGAESRRHRATAP
jgi:glycosyltransferase involved in cell wall biosynthesis